MTKLFLAPVTEFFYKATLEEPIDLSDWKERPPKFPQQTRVWGINTDPMMGNWPRNNKRWNQIERNDLILFYKVGNYYPSRQKEKYFAKGRVGVKSKTEYIRDHYWDKSPAISVFSIHDYEGNLNLKKEQLNDLLDYKDRFHPQGFWLVNDERPVGELLDHIDIS